MPSHCTGGRIARWRQLWAAHRLEVLLVTLGAMLLLIRVLVPALQQAPNNSTWTALLPGERSPQVLIGSGRDLLGTLWTFDYAQGVLIGANPTVDEGIFVPVGFDLGEAQGFAWVDAWFASGLVALWGVPGFYNAHVLLTMVGLLVAVHLLLRWVGTPPGPALGLAFAIAASPYMLRELYEGRPTQVFLLPHLAFVAAAWGLVRARLSAPLLAIAAGLLLALGCFVYWFSGIAVGLVTGIAVALAAVTHPKRRRRILGGGVLLSIAALTAALGPAWRLARGMGSENAWMGGEQDTAVTVELFGLLPLTLHSRGLRHYASWLEWFQQLFEEPGIPWVLGLFAALSLLGLRTRWRRQLPWVLAALATLSLPMFALFSVGEADTTLPSARGLLELVFPPIIRCHQPNRLAIAPMLALAMAAGIGLQPLFSQLSSALRQGLGWLSAAVLIAGTLAEPSLLRDLNLRSAEVFPASGFYTQVVDTLPGGIIDVPLEMSIDEYAYQVVHRRPLLGGPGYGYEKVQPAAHAQAIAGNSFIQYLETLAASKRALRYHPAHLAALREWGLGIIVVHGNRSGVNLEEWEQRLGATAIVGPDQRWAFPLPRE